MEKIMLLREKKGQVLQVMYYMTDFIDMQDFNIGAVLRFFFLIKKIAFRIEV